MGKMGNYQKCNHLIIKKLKQNSTFLKNRDSHKCTIGKCGIGIWNLAFGISLIRLVPVQLRISAVHFHELIMRALLCDAAIV